jgi:hypothetical protein
LLCDSREREMNELEKSMEKLRTEWDSDWAGAGVILILSVKSNAE